jgi:hypothetical protein
LASLAASLTAFYAYLAAFLTESAFYASVVSTSSSSSDSSSFISFVLAA